MDCHIEIFHEGEWLEAAQASFSDVVRNGFRPNDCVFEYDLLYAFGNAPPPISLVLPVDADRHVRKTWPTFLYDLVPQGNGRRLLLDHLKLPDAQASDLPLLRAGAFNPSSWLCPNRTRQRPVNGATECWRPRPPPGCR
jgi:serine/threonine-protein kinase HipA